MSKIHRTDEYEKQGKVVDWINDFLTSYAGRSSIQDMLDFITGKQAQTVEGVVAKYREMAGLDKIADEIEKTASAGPSVIAPMKLKKTKNKESVLKEYKKEDLWVQPKIDGIKTMAIKTDGDVAVYSRRGQDFSANVKPLVKELNDKMGSGDFWLGELAWIKDGRQSISDIQTILGSTPENAQKKLQEKGQMVFFVYDCLWAGNKDISKSSYTERYNKLKNKTGSGTKHIKLVENHSFDEIDKVVDKAIKEGGEGAVIKYKKGEYKYASKGESEPQGEQWKYKPKGRTAKTDEVILKEYHKGKEKLIFPAFQYKDDKLFEVGQVSGMSKEDEAKIKKQIDAGKKVVIEVSFQERMSSGKFRHMAWVGFRGDKPASEVKMASRKLSKRQ